MTDAKARIAADDVAAPGGRLMIEARAELLSGSATALVLEIDLAAGLTFLPPDPLDNVGQFCSATGQVVTCRLEQADMGESPSTGGFMYLEVGREVAVGTVLPVVARARVEGATDAEPGNDTATDSVRVVDELNVGVRWAAARYSTPPTPALALTLTVVNHADAAVRTFVTVSDPVFADGKTGLTRSELNGDGSMPPFDCSGDPGFVRCDLDLAAGEQVVLQFSVRVDPADAGHVLGVRARSQTGSVDATRADDVAVALLDVADAATAAPTESSAAALPSELAATGLDLRAPALLAVLGLLSVAGGVVAVRFSARRDDFAQRQARGR